MRVALVCILVSALVDVSAFLSIAFKSLSAFALKAAFRVDTLCVRAAVMHASGTFVDVSASYSVSFELWLAGT